MRYSIQNFRGIAILFVVLSHLASWHSLGAAGHAAHFLFAESTSWFVFISGYLFFHTQKKGLDYGDYMVKKARNVVSPYLVLSVPALALGFVLARPVELGLSPAGYTAWSLAVGGSVVGPMWFIPMILLFFLAAPLFWHLAMSRWLFPVAAAAIALSLFTARPLANLNPFLAFVHFAGFYILGMAFAVAAPALSHLKENGSDRIVILCALLVFLVAGLLQPPGWSEAAGFFDGWGKLNLAQLGRLGLLVALYLFLERYADVPIKALSFLAEISFGLFFIHGFSSLLYWKLTQLNMNSMGWHTMVGEVLVVVFGSVLAVFVLKTLFGKASRYVIGC